MWKILLMCIGVFISLPISSSFGANYQYTPEQLQRMEEEYGWFENIQHCQQSGFVDIGYLIHDIEWIGSCHKLTGLTKDEKGYLIKRIHEDNVVLSLRLQRYFDTQTKEINNKTPLPETLKILNKKKQELKKYLKAFKYNLSLLSFVIDGEVKENEIAFTKDRINMVNRSIRNINQIIKDSSNKVQR